VPAFVRVFDALDASEAIVPIGSVYLSSVTTMFVSETFPVFVTAYVQVISVPTGMVALSSPFVGLTISSAAFCGRIMLSSSGAGLVWSKAAVAVLSTLPAWMSACATASVAVYVQVSPTSRIGRGRRHRWPGRRRRSPES